MRKIPHYYENPIDNILLDFSDKLVPFLKKNGHTPNMITTYSFVCGLVSLYFLWYSQIEYFIIFYSMGYIFDCIDGHMARKYNIVTKFGDLYDHLTDYIIGIGIVYILIVKYSDKITINHIIGILILILLMQRHIGCQQKFYTENRKTDDNVIESITSLSKFCRKNEDMRWTRFFGTGTFNIVLLALIYDISSRK